MDRDQWIADMAATKADARELGALDPTITVKANVAEALAQLEELHAASGDTSSTNTVTTVGTTVTNGGTATTDAVAAAERRMAAAMVASQIAMQAEDLAAQRLDAAQTARGRTDISVAAAELALARATNTSSAAQAKTLASGEALLEARRQAAAAALAAAAAAEAEAAAEKKAAAAALEDAAAQDQVAKSTNTAGSSMSRFQTIFTAVVAPGPGLIPIATFAAGAGAALTSMLAVGVLAIVGIKNEMKSGSAEANDFAAGLGLLKGDVAQLEQTASKGVLNGFSTIVAELNANMPELNSETSLYSRVLGAIAAVGFGGVLSSFHALSPLIIDVDAYLLSVTTRLAAFAASPGMRQFVTYAQQSLPTVENLLNSLVTLAFHVLAAFAPWGTVVVDTLTAVSNVINAIPTPILSTLIELALGGSLAFKAWDSIPGMLMSVATRLGAVELAEGGATVATGALGAAIDFASGPIGWIVAGLGALIAVLAATSAAQATAATTTNAYTAAIQADNGVIGENVRQQAAKNLQDAGAIDNAKKLGISTLTLVSASLGNTAAIKAVNDALDKQRAKLDAQQKAAEATREGSILVAAAQKGTRAEIDNVSQSINTQTSDLKSSMKAYNDLQTSLGQSTISTKAQYDAATELADRYGMSLSTYQQVVAAQKTDAAQAALTTQKMQAEGDAVGLLTAAFNLLNGKTLNIAQAQTSFDSSLLDVTDSLKKNGDTLANNTRAGLANQQVIQSSILAAQAHAEAISGGTKLTEAGTAAYRADLIALRDQISAVGGNTSAIQAMIDKLAQVPKATKTTVEMDTSAALKALAQLRSAIAATLASANARSAALTITGKLQNVGAGHAAGGTIRGPGSGTSDTAGLFPLSDGEEVIAAAPASKYRSFLKALNSGSSSAIGNEVAKISGIPSGAAPSTTGTSLRSPSAAVSTSAPVIHNHHWSVITQADPTAAIKDGIRQMSARIT
jgi:hypothetical protein